VAIVFEDKQSSVLWRFLYDCTTKMPLPYQFSPVVHAMLSGLTRLKEAGPLHVVPPDEPFKSIDFAALPDHVHDFDRAIALILKYICLQLCSCDEELLHELAILKHADFLHTYFINRRTDHRSQVHANVLRHVNILGLSKLTPALHHFANEAALERFFQTICLVLHSAGHSRFEFACAILSTFPSLHQRAAFERCPTFATLEILLTSTILERYNFQFPMEPREVFNVFTSDLDHLKVALFHSPHLTSTDLDTLMSKLPRDANEAYPELFKWAFEGKIALMTKFLAIAMTKSGEFFDIPVAANTCLTPFPCPINDKVDSGIQCAWSQQVLALMVVLKTTPSNESLKQIVDRVWTVAWYHDFVLDTSTGETIPHPKLWVDHADAAGQLQQAAADYLEVYGKDANENIRTLRKNCTTVLS
jgi:hypothetical protein